MSKVKNEIAVGILFFAALLILGYFTLITKEDLFSKREYYRINVMFGSVEGLGQADRVKVNGVESGIVETIKLLDNNDVLVRLKMHGKFLLYENYEIRIKNETALGGKYISIDPGTDYLNNEKYALIDFNKILVGRNTGDILSNLSDIIAENRQDIRKSIRNFEEITDMIAENRPNINRSIRNLEDITAKINSGQGTFGKLINENKVHDDTDDLITEVRQNLEDAREQAPITSFIKAALGFL